MLALIQRIVTDGAKFRYDHSMEGLELHRRFGVMAADLCCRIGINEGEISW
jgi:hypothetical protein